MADWNAGYVAEVEYIHGYYRELCPGVLNLAALSRSLQLRQERPLRYLELGFGQGLSLNIHAAATPGEYWGTDFLPAHAINAQELADASGANVRVLCDSFAELAARDDLPEFDIIVAHGIWSWISQDNRDCIVDLVRRKLALGGALYISYNCLPGWAPTLPMRHLMSLHAEYAGTKASGLASRIDGALDFAQKLSDAEGLYFKVNPAAKAQLANLREQSRNYLAHEYFNKDWQVMPFAEVARQLSVAKLEFGASAQMLLHVDFPNLTEAGKALLAGIEDTVLRESAFDYLINQQFRRDIFVKGRRPLPPPLQLQQIIGERFMLLTHPEDIPMKVNGARGEAGLNKDLFVPLIAALADNNFAPKTGGELLNLPFMQGQTLKHLMNLLMIMIGSGHVHPVQPQALADEARPRTQALNAHLLKRARDGSGVDNLASPATGGGFRTMMLDQLFLLAGHDGHESVEARAQYVWHILEGQSRRLTKSGKPIDTPEGNLAEMQVQARAFVSKKLPLLKAAGIA